MKIDADEKELLESVERGEWKSAGGATSSVLLVPAQDRVAEGEVARAHSMLTASGPVA
jgi:hypothetical protein